MTQQVIDFFGVPCLVLETKDNFRYKILKGDKIEIYYKINDCFLKNTSLSFVEVFRIKEAKLLEILSQDEDIYIRLHVARNPYTSQLTLEKLSDDENIKVSDQAFDSLEKLYKAQFCGQ